METANKNQHWLAERAAVESPSSNLLALRAKAAWGQYLKTHRQFQPLEIVKQIAVVYKGLVKV